MKLIELYRNVFLVSAHSKHELGRVFCRFQEHYESPKFRGKTFSMQEFKRYYSGKKRFTYYGDWDGYNIPGSILHPFAVGQFNPLSKGEIWLLDRIGGRIADRGLARQVARFGRFAADDPFYIIGAPVGDRGTLAHELAHAMFHLDPHYLSSVTQLVGSHQFKGLVAPIKSLLLKSEYTEEVLPDEVNAYMLFDKDYLVRKRVWSPDLDLLRTRLLEEYKLAKARLKRAPRASPSPRP